MWTAIAIILSCVFINFLENFLHLCYNFIMCIYQFLENLNRPKSAQILDSISLKEPMHRTFSEGLWIYQPESVQTIFEDEWLVWLNWAGIMHLAASRLNKDDHQSWLFSYFLSSLLPFFLIWISQWVLIFSEVSLHQIKFDS